MNTESVEEITELFKALSDPTRMRIMLLLATPEDEVNEECCCEGGRFYCVNALADQLCVSQSAISQHLRVLRQCNLVRGERKGKFMHYVIEPSGMEMVCKVQELLD